LRYFLEFLRYINKTIFVNKKTIVITGGTSGIGQATLEKLTTFGSNLVVLVRNTQKAEQIKSEILKAFPKGKIEIIECDLASLQSVKNAAEKVNAKYPVIDVLINNAGGVFSKFEKTVDGFEYGFQINHLGHFLLSNLLIENLKASNDPRIICVSSEAHRIGKINFANLNCEKKFSTWGQYGATKLMNILFVKAIANKFDKIKAFALHPGVVKTGFGANNGGFLKYFNKMPFLITPEKGAETSIYLATQDIGKLNNGGYYKKCQIAYSSLESQDVDAQNKLWEISYKLLKDKSLLN
jgi:NAD(P)-dependent dehydrogenase (short-subunit alcohol dehydrogenase family)